MKDLNAKTKTQSQIEGAAEGAIESIDLVIKQDWLDPVDRMTLIIASAETYKKRLSELNKRP